MESKIDEKILLEIVKIQKTAKHRFKALNYLKEKEVDDSIHEEYLLQADFELLENYKRSSITTKS